MQSQAESLSWMLSEAAGNLAFPSLPDIGAPLLPLLGLRTAALGCRCFRVACAPDSSSEAQENEPDWSGRPGLGVAPPLLHLMEGPPSTLLRAELHCWGHLCV